MWNLLIYDDDKLFLKQFRKQIIDTAGDIIGNISCISDQESFQFHLEEKFCKLPCIAIVEIKFKSGISGLEIAKQLLSANPLAQIIFMSEYQNYSFDVYEVEHIFFLEKPIKKESLDKALRHADKKLQRLQPQVLPIVTRTFTVAVPVEQIIYLEKANRKINVFTEERTSPYTFYAKFSEIEKYGTVNFCRCHNSYVINLKYIKEMQGTSFYMINGAKIPISRNKYQNAKECYLRFLQRGDL